MENDHFVNNTLSELQKANRNPISDYKELLVLTLEDAVEKLIPLIPNVNNYLLTAKNECNHHSTLLTRDESAAIYLYSMPISFFGRLNEALRAENRQALEPWLAFLKLFINALEKLLSIKRTVWRGVSGNVGSIFADGRERVWWSVNSCSKELKVVEQRLGDTGTVFAIDVIHGKDISAFSTFPEEQEIVLMPGTHVKPKCQSLSFDDRFFLIHLEENLESEPRSDSSHVFELVYQVNTRSSTGFSITNHFNNLFGSNITYVANAYSTSENQWIWICFHTEVLSLEIIRLAINTERNDSIETNWKHVTRHKLVRVSYHDVYKQRRHTASEFLTIISHDRKWIIPNYVIEANRSFIVTRQREIVPQKYGGNLWEDESGINHY